MKSDFIDFTMIKPHAPKCQAWSPQRNCDCSNTDVKSNNTSDPIDETFTVDPSWSAVSLLDMPGSDPGHVLHHLTLLTDQITGGLLKREDRGTEGQPG